jgi:predicted HNH restriction endonuclease
LCERCMNKGVVKPATLVHHKQSIRNGGAVYAMDNLMSVCIPCHDEIHRKQGDKWNR